MEMSKILIIDDNETFRESMGDLLRAEGYNVKLVMDGHEALQQAVEFRADIVLLDVMMPGIDGYGVCREIRSHSVTSEVVIILITGLTDSQSRLKGIEAGADDYLTKPVDRIELRARLKTILRLNRYRKLCQAEETILASHRKLEEAYEATLAGWAKALELRERETAGHSVRVVQQTMSMANQLGFTEEELVNIRRGALLHDIGKLGIPDNILLKPGPLDETEWDIMKLHTFYAKSLLSPIDYLNPALDIPLYHHEKWDGSGYPEGLRGEKIPLPARIFAIVDVYDALIHERPYRPAWHQSATLQYLKEQAGKQFDPRLIEIFLDLCQETTDAKQ